jgi:hypothetical protein
VVGTVLAHQTIDVGGRALPSNHGFTIAILISLAASAVALGLALAIPARKAA